MYSIYCSSITGVSESEPWNTKCFFGPKVSDVGQPVSTLWCLLLTVMLRPPQRQQSPQPPQHRHAQPPAQVNKDASAEWRHLAHFWSVFFSTVAWTQVLSLLKQGSYANMQIQDCQKKLLSLWDLNTVVSQFRFNLLNKHLHIFRLNSF